MDQNDDDYYNQQTDLEIIEILLPYLKHKSFIDIGAEKGTFTKFLSDHGLQGTLFEPLPKFAAALTDLANMTKSNFFPYAIDSMDRKADFYGAFDCHDNPTDHFSSLYPLINDERIKHKKIGNVVCRSLDSLLKEGCINKHIGVVKIDTEGNDLNVIKGMQEIESDVLVCEFFTPNIYSGWELGHPHKIIEAASRLNFNHHVIIKRIAGYELVTIENSIFQDKQWGNIIFIKDDIYKLVLSSIKTVIANKESFLINNFLKTKNKLEDICKERLDSITQYEQEIKRFKKICNEREEIVQKQEIEIKNLTEICTERLTLINRLHRKSKLEVLFQSMKNIFSTNS